MFFDLAGPAGAGKVWWEPASCEPSEADHSSDRSGPPYEYRHRRRRILQPQLSVSPANATLRPIDSPVLPVVDVAQPSF